MLAGFVFARIRCPEMSPRHAFWRAWGFEETIGATDLPERSFRFFGCFEYPRTKELRCEKTFL
jgi:hypothetical protein